MLVPEVFSDWGKHLKHFNSHLWPGTDSILIAYVEDEQAEEIMRVIKKNENRCRTYDIYGSGTYSYRRYAIINNSENM